MGDRYLFLPRVTRVPGDPWLHELLGCFGPERRAVLLDTATSSVAQSATRDAAAASGSFSLLGFDPVAVADAKVRELRDLGAFAARLERVPGGDLLPDAFHGGFLGALAYDLGVAGERLSLPPEPWRFPLVVGGLYTDFFVRDPSGRTWLVLGDEPGDGRAELSARRDALLAAVAEPPRLAPLRAAGPLVRCTESAEHRARIERARAAIAAGEIYQANIAHRLTRAVQGDPRELYRRLRSANPAPYMGYVAFEGGAVLSSSPELLLEFEPGGGEHDEKPGAPRSARTRPIKGTIERGTTPAEDAARAAHLFASAKDRAELTMIVDLERNDLGRIAEVGSVRVGAFPRLESYATVHHLVADVACTPRAGVSALDALAVLFPGGSVTGAPKLRSMEIIAELEGEGRGFFTGSLGMLDLRGRAVFNILIRTLLWRPLSLLSQPSDERSGPRGEVSFRVGGGITWASDAAAEDAETLAKGRALAAALERG